MPTSIKDIVAHRNQMLAATLRDTPEQVVVAMDAAIIARAFADTDVDLSSTDGIETFITRLQLNSRNLQKLSAKDMPTLEKLGRRKPENVIIAKGSQPHRSTCWVRDGYSGYRSAFTAFVKKTYGNVDFTGYKEIEIDHLASRGQARMGDKFIRIEGVDKSVNRAHGASVEKKQAGQTKRHVRVKDGLTLLSVLKLYGLKPPRTPGDGERLDQIRKVLKADGWDMKEVSTGIENLLRLYARDMS